jgi:Transposase IS116/IS110/IS902 family
VILNVSLTPNRKGVVVLVAEEVYRVRLEVRPTRGVPPTGVGWVLAYTIASEIGDVRRFASPKKLAGYTGLCPLVRQSGGKDRRGPLAKNGPNVPALGADRGRHPCRP